MYRLRDNTDASTLAPEYDDPTMTIAQAEPTPSELIASDPWYATLAIVGAIGVAVILYLGLSPAGKD